MGVLRGPALAWVVFCDFPGFAAPIAAGRFHGPLEASPAREGCAAPSEGLVWPWGREPLPLPAAPSLLPLCVPSLKLECDKLASEKSEMQRHYVMVRPEPLPPEPLPPGGRQLREPESSRLPFSRPTGLAARLGSGRGAKPPGCSPGLPGPRLSLAALEEEEARLWEPWPGAGTG